MSTNTRRPAAGERFRLARPVDRFPHFLAPTGASGTVTHSDEHTICLHMDEYLAGAEKWDNEIVWSADEDQDANGNPSAAASFYRDTEPLTGPPGEQHDAR
jgi:hypothetical protein